MCRWFFRCFLLRYPALWDHHRQRGCVNGHFVGAVGFIRLFNSARLSRVFLFLILTIWGRGTVSPKRVAATWQQVLRTEGWAWRVILSAGPKLVEFEQRGLCVHRHAFRDPPQNTHKECIKGKLRLTALFAALLACFDEAQRGRYECGGGFGLTRNTMRSSEKRGRRIRVALSRTARGAGAPGERCRGGCLEPDARQEPSAASRRHRGAGRTR